MLQLDFFVRHYIKKKKEKYNTVNNFVEHELKEFSN